MHEAALLMSFKHEGPSFDWHPGPSCFNQDLGLDFPQCRAAARTWLQNMLARCIMTTGHLFSVRIPVLPAVVVYLAAVTLS